MVLTVWFFQGVEKMSSVTISYILARGLSIPLTFIFVQEQNDINIAALIQGGATFVAGMISIYFVYKT
ncbi:oligosaccharide flippase family protein, partial [Escherichia coli]|nr:oligosaccharide flippase family protein [Escherichia coli]